MSWYTLNNEEKITSLLKYLISNRAEIEVRMKGDETVFASRFMHISYDHEEVSSKIGGKPPLIIEKLTPEEGNTLIQSVPRLFLGFLINENRYRCLVEYLGN